MKAVLDQIPDQLSRLEQVFPTAVTITRTSPSDFGSRQLEVSIDGTWVATLLWGDSVTRELEPGAHWLRVHNTLVWKTVEFTLEPKEQLFFEVVNRPGFGTYWMTLAFGVGPLYVSVRQMR